jgi:hypothetical protein
MVTLRIDEKTTVCKVTTSHDLSPLTIGDEVRVTYYGEGALTAVNVSAQVTLSGVITESSPAHLTVVPNSTPDATASDGKAAVFVFLSHTTQFGASRNQVTAGRKVHIVGWDSGNGVIEAEKVAIDDADQPARRNPSRPPRER